MNSTTEVDFLHNLGYSPLGMLPTALADLPADGGSFDVVERSFSRPSGPQPNSLPHSGQAQGRDPWPDEFVVELDGLDPDATPLILRSLTCRARSLAYSASRPVASEGPPMATQPLAETVAVCIMCLRSMIWSF